MIYAPVVAKMGSKWYVGFLRRYKFEPNYEIKKLADIKEQSGYKGLISFTKDRKLSERILKKTGCDSMYILSKPIGLTPKQFEKYWWTDHFQKCKTCINDCKQSHMIKELKCKQYKRG